MNFSNVSVRFSKLLTIFLLVCAWGILPASLQASVPTAGNGEQAFTSPDDAIKALRASTQTNNRAALRVLFGPEFFDFITGDPVQDANNVKEFAAKMAQSCRLVNNGEDKIILEVGTNNWPFPIPLAKADGQWYFDTAAGKEEMINRHIGKDELNAIGACRAYVEAQRQYASMNPEGAAGVRYALQIKSSPGRKNGLYWPTTANAPPSPFGSIVAEADAEGYDFQVEGRVRHARFGYYFRIITQQGPEAPGGKMDYLSDGNLTGGFALVAYPEHWGKSGIMTFIVNQDGKVYQHNFGERTLQLASALKEYNPDKEWTLVQDEGVLRAASER